MKIAYYRRAAFLIAVQLTLYYKCCCHTNTLVFLTVIVYFLNKRITGGTHLFVPSLQQTVPCKRANKYEIKCQ